MYFLFNGMLIPSSLTLESFYLPLLGWKILGLHPYLDKLSYNSTDLYLLGNL